MDFMGAIKRSFKAGAERAPLGWEEEGLIRAEAESDAEAGMKEPRKPDDLTYMRYFRNRNEELKLARKL